MIEEIIKTLISKRRSALKNAKEIEEALLVNFGVVANDTPDGTRWSLTKTICLSGHSEPLRDCLDCWRIIQGINDKSYPTQSELLFKKAMNELSRAAQIEKADAENIGQDNQGAN